MRIPHHLLPSFKSRPQEPAHVQIARSQLAKAELDLLEHTSQLEYYAATVPMLTQRVQRLHHALNTYHNNNDLPCRPHLAAG